MWCSATGLRSIVNVIHELVTKNLSQIRVDIYRIACGRYLSWLLLCVVGFQERVKEVYLRQQCREVETWKFVPVL